MSSWNELLSELGTVQVNHPDALTRREVMKAAGLGEKAATEYIRVRVEQGLLIPTRKLIKDLAGRPQTVPAYQPVKKGKK